MTDTRGILRFAPEGPPGQGLVPISDITPDMVEAGAPQERCHDYYTSPSGVLTAGVWKCTPHTLHFGPYPVDEFMLVLDGEVRIVYADGSEDVFRAGDAFVLPRGLLCQWKQVERVHKVYVILEHPDAPLPERPATERAIRLHPSDGLTRVELPKPENFEGGTPVQEDHTAYEDPTGRFCAGTWTCSPMRRRADRFGRTELMCLLEGGMTLTEEGGAEHRFRAPDVLLELPDTVNAWTSDENVRKYYCSFEE